LILLDWFFRGDLNESWLKETTVNRRPGSFKVCLREVCLRAGAFAVLSSLVWADSFSAVLAQTPAVLLPPQRRQYSPLDAGADAYRAEEGRRMAEIDSQLGLNNRMRYQSWYGSLYRGVFEAWPMVPGDIWGYPMLNPVRQSIGQRSYQAGPNRWISEPVYATDIVPTTAATVGGIAGAPINRPAVGRGPGLGPIGEVAPRPNLANGAQLPAPRPEPGDVPAPTGPREF
jgi:hypothetical protein